MDKLLKYFIVEPEREYHIRELAKLTKLSPTTISKYLNEFSKKEILVFRKKFNHLLFKADNENPNFRDIKFSYNLRILRESGLIDFLIKEFNHPKAIILFGSFAKAEDNLNSDIDILIITPIRKDVDLKKFENILKHKIQLFLHSNKEIDKIKIKNKELINNWVNGIRLYGFWEIFK